MLELGPLRRDLERRHERVTNLGQSAVLLAFLAVWVGPHERGALDEKHLRR